MDNHDNIKEAALAIDVKNAREAKQHPTQDDYQRYSE